MKLTRQGVRDLGNNSRVRRDPIVVACPHVWEYERQHDCWLEIVTTVKRCGLCHEVRR